MLKRRAPATASGLKTLWDCGAWPYLLDAPYDAEAVNALAALGWEDAPLAGRLALLLREMKPSELQSALLRLRFSTRDAVLAARYGAALRHFATGQGGAFETVQLGRDAVTYAAVAFQALGDAADEARAKGALDALRDAPWSLRELAVGGDALMPLLTARGVPAGRWDACWKRCGVWRSKAISKMKPPRCFARRKECLTIQNKEMQFKNAACRRLCCCRWTAGL